MLAAVLLLAASGTGALDAMVKSATACPPSATGEITVCGTRERERSRYLPPLPLEYEPGDPRARSVSAERNGLFDYDGGGLMTCSNVGPFGGAGCFAKSNKRKMQQRAGAPDPRGWLSSK